MCWERLINFENNDKKQETKQPEKREAAPRVHIIVDKPQVRKQAVR